MWQFIISGYVPGTDLQLNYEVLATFFLVSGIVLLFILLAQDEKQLRREISKQAQTNTV